jgi:four helix bundle protein
MNDFDNSSRQGGKAPRRKLGDFKLRILGDIVRVVKWVKRLADRIKDHDPDLADQLHRASTSLATNSAEGSRARGRRKQSQLNIAMQSGRESIICLELAAALAYLDEDEAEQVCDELDRIIATLFKVARWQPR